MGVGRMNKKKYLSGMISFILLLTIFTSTYSAQTGNLRIVYGIVYINGVEAPDGVTVQLNFPDQTITNDTYANGNYVMNFDEIDYEEGTFLVQYLGAWYSTNPATVELGDQHDIEYNKNLKPKPEIQHNNRKR